MEAELKASENVQEIKQQKEQLEYEFDQLKDRFEASVTENGRFKAHINSLTNQLRQSEKLVENMNKKIMDSLDTETQLDKMKNKNNKLYERIKLKENEIQNQQIEIQNLQDALEELQESGGSKPEPKKFQRIDKTDHGLTEKYNKLREEFDNFLPQIDSLEKYKSQVTELCASNAELIQKYKDLEKSINKKVEAKFLSHMKEKNLIDSAMINTFLVQYIRHGEDPMIQKQMLKAMAGILNFTGILFLYIYR